MRFFRPLGMLLVIIATSMLFLVPAHAQDGILQFWFVGNRTDYPAAAAAFDFLSDLAQKNMGVRFALEQIDPDAVMVNLEAGEKPDALVADSIYGSDLYFAGRFPAYCLPDQCPDCDGPNPPPWCPFAARDIESRIGGIAVGGLQSWMSYETGTLIVPYGLPLWWSYIPESEFQLEDPIMPTVTVYGLYPFPENEHLSEMMAFFAEVITSEEIQYNLADLTGMLPVNGAIPEAARAIEDLQLLSRAQNLRKPFILSSRHCIDFEDIPLGTPPFHVGDIFTSRDFDIEVAGFQGSTGGFTSSHWPNGPGGLGEMTINNVILYFELANQVENIYGSGAVVTGLSLRFGEYGGANTFEINGAPVTIELISQLNGMHLGGTQLTTVGGYGNDTGYVAALGNIATMRVGGQELFVDDVCLEIHGP